MSIVLAVSAFGILLVIVIVIVIYRYVRYHVVDVLVAITNALADLAFGNLAVVVSGRDRQDEIGRMVRALEVFRTQANQLERNHLAAIEAQTRAERWPVAMLSPACPIAGCFSRRCRWSRRRRTSRRRVADRSR